MPRYELIDGSSSKFWEIDLEGTSFTTTYGRIGTDGQSSLKEYDSEEKAKKEHDKLVLEKTKKGYKLVAEGGAAPNAAAPSPPPVATVAKPAPPATVASKPSEPEKRKPVFEDEGDDEDDDVGEERPRVHAAGAGASPPPAVPTPAVPTPSAMAMPKPTAAAATPARSSKGDTPGARYFEFVDGGSSKFWEIVLDGTSFTTRYGKIGTDGQQSLKEYDSEAKALSEHDKLVVEKTKKGYVEK